MFGIMVPFFGMFTRILFVVFPVALIIIAAPLRGGPMVKMINASMVTIKIAIIVVVISSFDSIRPIVIKPPIYSALRSMPEAPRRKETKSHGDKRQHDRLLRHFIYLLS